MASYNKNNISGGPWEAFNRDSVTAYACVDNAIDTTATVTATSTLDDLSYKPKTINSIYFNGEKYAIGSSDAITKSDIDCLATVSSVDYVSDKLADVAARVTALENAIEKPKETYRSFKRADLKTLFYMREVE